jgi:ABC-2 type transport system permease protein
VSDAALLWRQFRWERRLFWRNPSAAFFNFLLPLLLLLLVASVFASDAEELDVLIPGVAGMSVMATTFSALAMTLTLLREQGILKRMRGTPLPPATLLGGLVLSSVVNAVAQVALVVVIGHVLYDVDWPRSVPELALWTALGVTCFAALGIAFAHAIPNADSAPAYTNAVFLPAVFISGVFYSAESLPPVLEGIAQALPLKHVIDGLSSAIVTGDGLQGTALAVTAAWTLAGLVLAVRYFRWDGERPATRRKKARTRRP